MATVFAAVPKSMLEERRRLGHDESDERWDGVLHMVPPPGAAHQRLGAELFVLHDGALVPAPSLRSDVLGVTFETVEGPKLRITWDGGSAEL